MLPDKLKLYLPFFIGLATGIYFFNLSVIYLDWSHVPGDLGDARLNNYLLEHAYQFMTGKIDSFWNAPFLYPEKNVITYSDNQLGASIFYALFRIVGFNREVSFQCWFVLISALNYTACYFLLVYLFRNRYAAVLGAMIFAFSIALHSQMVHAQTFPRFAIPLTFLMGALFVKELKPVYFFGALFFLVYQFYCGIYLGFMLSISLTLFLLASLIVKWKLYRLEFKNIKWWSLILLAIIANIAILLPLMIPYLHRAQQMDLYSYEKILQSVPTIRSFFYSHYGSLFWEFLKGTGYKYESFWDHQIFAGGVAILCLIAFAGFIFLKSLRVKLFAKVEINATLYLLFFTGLFTFLFFMRFQGNSLYKYIHLLPGFASMRSLQRIINVELLFFAVAVAFIFSLILRKENKYSGILFLGFVALIYLDNHIQEDTTDCFEIVQTKTRVEPLTKKMELLKPGTIISYEPDTIIGKVLFYQLDAMLAAQLLGLKTLNGYTSTAPKEYSYYWERPKESSRLRWLKQNQLSPDSVVVIH